MPVLSWIGKEYIENHDKEIWKHLNNLHETDLQEKKSWSNEIKIHRSHIQKLNHKRKRRFMINTINDLLLLHRRLLVSSF